MEPPLRASRESPTGHFHPIPYQKCPIRGPGLYPGMTFGIPTLSCFLASVPPPSGEEGGDDFARMSQVEGSEEEEGEGEGR